MADPPEIVDEAVDFLLVAPLKESVRVDGWSVVTNAIFNGLLLWEKSMIFHRGILSIILFRSFRQFFRLGRILEKPSLG